MSKSGQYSTSVVSCGTDKCLPAFLSTAHELALNSPLCSIPRNAQHFDATQSLAYKAVSLSLSTHTAISFSFPLTRSLSPLSVSVLLATRFTRLPSSGHASLRNHLRPFPHTHYYSLPVGLPHHSVTGFVLCLDDYYAGYSLPNYRPSILACWNYTFKY